MIVPNVKYAADEIKKDLSDNPSLKSRALEYGNVYRGARGLMVVDVVASRQRRYDSYVVTKLLPKYRDKAKDLSLSALAAKSPNWLPLREGEAETMVSLARALLDYGKTMRIKGEDSVVYAWASDEKASELILDIKGIGPALLQYLRMRCGADSLKVDVRVMEELAILGIPVHWFTADGLLELCKEIAKEANCSMLELDQVLWHRNSLKK